MGEKRGIVREVLFLFRCFFFFFFFTVLGLLCCEDFL